MSRGFTRLARGFPLGKRILFGKFGKRRDKRSYRILKVKGDLICILHQTWDDG